MGILGKMFGKDSRPVPACDPLTVYAPAEGTVLPISEFPDELFRQGILGPGCGIQPSGDLVSAPFDGTVTHVIDTLHAVGLTSDDGAEVLIHIGVDTVNMGGKGFTSYVKDDQKVRKGDALIRFDREAIQKAGYSDSIAVVVTNSDQFAEVELLKTGSVTSGETLIKIRK